MGFNYRDPGCGLIGQLLEIPSHYSLGLTMGLSPWGEEAFRETNQAPAGREGSVYPIRYVGRRMVNECTEFLVELLWYFIFIAMTARKCNAHLSIKYQVGDKGVTKCLLQMMGSMLAFRHLFLMTTGGKSQQSSRGATGTFLLLRLQLDASWLLGLDGEMEKQPS